MADKITQDHPVCRARILLPPSRTGRRRRSTYSLEFSAADCKPGTRSRGPPLATRLHERNEAPERLPLSGAARPANSLSKPVPEGVVNLLLAKDPPTPEHRLALHWMSTKFCLTNRLEGSWENSSSQRGQESNLQRVTLEPAAKFRNSVFATPHLEQSLDARLSLLCNQGQCSVAGSRTSSKTLYDEFREKSVARSKNAPSESLSQITYKARHISNQDQFVDKVRGYIESASDKQTFFGRWKPRLQQRLLHRAPFCRFCRPTKSRRKKSSAGHVHPESQGIVNRQTAANKYLRTGLTPFDQDIAKAHASPMCSRRDLWVNATTSSTPPLPSAASNNLQSSAN